MKNKAKTWKPTLLTDQNSPLRSKYLPAAIERPSPKGTSSRLPPPNGAHRRGRRSRDSVEEEDNKTYSYGFWWTIFIVIVFCWQMGITSFLFSPRSRRGNPSQGMTHRDSGEDLARDQLRCSNLDALWRSGLRGGLKTGEEDMLWSRLNCDVLLKGGTVKDEKSPQSGSDDHGGNEHTKQTEKVLQGSYCHPHDSGKGQHASGGRCGRQSGRMRGC